MKQKIRSNMIKAFPEDNATIAEANPGEFTA